MEKAIVRELKTLAVRDMRVDWVGLGGFGFSVHESGRTCRSPLRCSVAVSVGRLSVEPVQLVEPKT